MTKNEKIFFWVNIFLIAAFASLSVYMSPLYFLCVIYMIFIYCIIAMVRINKE